MSNGELLKLPEKVKNSFDSILKVLGPARVALLANPDVAAVRPGYLYPPRGDPVPALVVAVLPGSKSVSAPDVEKQFNVPVSVIDATVEEQVAASSREAAPVSFGSTEDSSLSAFEALLTDDPSVVDFGPPKQGAYTPMDPPDLPLVNETMKATICVSPEAGWSELETFLSATTESLTVAMYQFTAPHIFEAVQQVVSPPGRTFELVLHPIPEKPPKSGVKADDLNEVQQVIDPLQAEMKDRFKMSWATLASKARPEGLWASAYHIKVAVRDGKTIWLSSGNWQSSNQPNVHPFEAGHDKLPAGFQRKYNRDYHAIIENDKLAEVYEAYIKRDYDLTTTEGKPESFSAPDLFVPVEEPEEPVVFAEPPQFFKPLDLPSRNIKVQPLLTPDNYAENALSLIKSATKSVWYQNQYINFRGTGEDFTEFRLLVNALKEKIDAKLDVRIICRDMMKQESVDVLVALGFPRDIMRFQPACHNKTIIVDGQVVMFGSHNWSNEGVRTNRDASLIFYDPEIAQYLSKVYEYDWERLAKAKPTASRPRVARAGQAPPAGYKRVPFSAVFDD
jgi:hypothetical protein